MTDFIRGENRFQSTLFPERLDDYIAEDGAVRVIDMFIEELDLSGLGFQAEPKAKGRPAYDPATLALNPTIGGRQKPTPSGSS